jgi:polyferredoxin
MTDHVQGVRRRKVAANARRRLIVLIYWIVLGGVAVMGWIFWANIYLLLGVVIHGQSIVP